MPIIAISGKINSGKDTVAKIIQIITSSPHFTNKAVVEFLEKPVLNPTWKVRRFADKLKDIVCLLLGCTREQLEDREFKEKELGEEWWYYKGRNGSLISYTESSKRSDEDLIKPTPRLLLQLLGTECGRQIIHPNIWVNALMSEYRVKDISIIKQLHKELGSVTLHDAAKLYEQGTKPKDMSKAEYPDWVITDMRFPNELEAVQAKDGLTIRINRPILNKNELISRNVANAKKGIAVADLNHPSETALDNAKFDHIITNKGTLTDLVMDVREILQYNHIID